MKKSLVSNEETNKKVDEPPKIIFKRTENNVLPFQEINKKV